MTADDRIYEIYEVAELTGLAPARLRAWERRYAVVRPERQANRYRAYTARQVALLRAYARLTQSGSRIGTLVKEPVEQVIARADAQDQDGTAAGAFLVALQRLDRVAMQQILETQLQRLGPVSLCDQVILPLAQVIGDRWALGTLPVALEHFASETVVATLKRALESAVSAEGPTLLAACLSGERHEWGLLSTLAKAQNGGWRASYLGPDLPISQFIEAAWRTRPALVALSASDPANVERQMPELQNLARRMPERTQVLAGGRGFAPHAAALRGAGIHPEPSEFPAIAAFMTSGKPGTS
jgi:methanogenic corrinoid protein MtbC1